MDTWKDWKVGEHKQLNQFHYLQMFGSDIEHPLKENSITLWSQWQYHVKRDGQQQDRQWCGGSNQEVPLLHTLDKTDSSYVEYSSQQQLLALEYTLI